MGEVELDEAAIRWSRRPDGGPLLVMLHGHGGNELDFPPLFDRVPAGVTAASLRGTTPLRDRFTWVDYPREVEAGGTAAVHAAGTAAVRAILRWLDTVPASRVALLGFSQGGAIALHLLRTAPTRVVAVAELSGFVWETGAHAEVARVHPPVFSAIGDRDDVIDPALRLPGEEWVRTHCDATIRRYPGVDHRMDDRMLHDALAFLAPFLLPDRRAGNTTKARTERSAPSWVTPSTPSGRCDGSW